MFVYGQIYVAGGFKNWYLSDTCVEFDPNCTGNNKLKEVAGMKQVRRYAACAVFEGNVVVSGGRVHFNRRLNQRFLTWGKFPCFRG